MLFNSKEFLFFFLPIVLMGYYALGRTGRLQLVMAWLFGASLLFYGWLEPRYLVVILVSIVFNFIIGRKLSAWRNDDARQMERKAVMFAGVAANLLALGYYKYAGFLVANIDTLFAADISIPKIVLPLGISFFTFQQIAFLVDAYRGKAAHADFLNYGVFITFFPQLIAGPIVHHREMMPQLSRQKVFDCGPERFAVGWTIFIIGLFKKVVLADYFDQFATPVFAAADQGQALHMAEAWIGALSYTLQIYFDFSGYSDMAIGLARLFGVRLPLNFYSPYKSVNVIDFWRRWHLTLSRFLRDYLYIPLGGNRKGKARRYVNLMITMLLGGLWHGAGWNFLIWGGLHGASLAVNHAWREAGMRLRPIVSTAVTFLFVVIAWVFFRAVSTTGAVHMLSSMFDFSDIMRAYAEVYDPVGVLATNVGKRGALGSVAGCLAALAFVFLCPNTSEIMRRYRPHIGSVGLKRVARGWLSPLWGMTTAWGLGFGVLTVVCLAKVLYEPSNVFLYFQF